MHTIKGGWVGQTFASAKCNESDTGSRKSRIRRSKEERKSMIESFIKKYQTKNNGNFPSLNLTHKEVGGSFYTVRAIVREIIQENRVLGPAKFSPEEKASMQVLQQDPLGSIAIEPNIPLLFENGMDLDATPAFTQDTGKELELIPNREYNDLEQLTLKDGKVNGGQIDLRNEESKVAAVSGLRVAEKLETSISIDASASISSTSSIVHLTSVEVETFPLKSIPISEDNINKNFGEVRNSPGTSEEKHIDEANSRPSTCDSYLRKLTFERQSFLDGKADASPLAEENSAAGDVTEVERHVNPSFQSPDCSATNGGIAHDTEEGKTVDHKVFVDEEIKNTAGMLDQDASNGVHSNSGYSAYNIIGSDNSLKEIEIKVEAGIKSNGNSSKESSPTLDRMNLESWEASSKKSSREVNPVLAIFKAFITSFIKFWSE